MPGILTGPEIIKQVFQGRIEISDFNLEQVNPASYDLRLGDKVAVYSSVVGNFRSPTSDYDMSEEGADLSPLVKHKLSVLDAAKDNPIKLYQIKDRFLLKPGIGYLMHTKEEVKTDFYEPILDGKSSIGRLFATSHVTAGFGDPGFNGQYTLEVVVTHPLYVYKNMKFCQIRFHSLEGEIQLYKGAYQDETSRGPVGSKSFKQFKK